ncbi:GNAT family N-acetyltransferase [Lysinibacillus sp. LZ02]|uniref:GNAT family N-acetyltransferase n=1 Tax=Lysinibacillus sp. LZ02 TaxID=3420668 RepID=UPI003D35C0DB
MIRKATREDVAQILAIFNYNIVHSTAIYLYEEQTLETRLAWFDAKVQAGEPVLVYEIDGRVAGYATYGKFRPQAAYQYTIEHSIYVHEDFQRMGIAKQLMHRLIEEAKADNYRTMIACIDADNEGSIRMHEKFGFTHGGVLKEVGYKFGKWLDLCLMQLKL